MAKPKPVKVESTRADPGAFSTLLDYLKSNGQAHEIPRYQIRKARALFVIHSHKPKEIAKQLKVPVSEIERWALAFGWYEERDHRLFTKFRALHEMRSRNGANLDERHDRILGTLESVAEQVLQRHMDGEIELSPGDLRAISGVIKDATSGRRSVHNKEGTTTRKIIELQAPSVFNNIAAAVMRAAKPEHIINATVSSPSGTKSLPAPVDSISIARDAEYELEEEGDDDEA